MRHRETVPIYSEPMDIHAIKLRSQQIAALYAGPLEPKASISRQRVLLNLMVAAGRTAELLDGGRISTGHAELVMRVIRSELRRV